MASSKRRGVSKSSPHPAAPSAPPPANPRGDAAVALSRAGIVLHHADRASETVPLLSGAVHYWRIPRASWRPALQALRAMELRFVETYVPWQAHEIETRTQARDEARDEARDDAPPKFSFRGQLDVGAFLREAHDLGLRAIVRPGPHINAELTDFGLPERVLWNRDCQARTPKQNPVMLPAPPRAFPVPSYASKAFLAETSRWFSAVGAELRDLLAPNGPVALVQIDNEGALYFRDGVYDQDYHPDAVAHYRAFLRDRYRSIEELARAYGMALTAFDEVPPPTRYDVESGEDLPRHLEWAEAQETLLAGAFSQMSRALRDAGVVGVPLFHNLPMGESATPLSPGALRRSDNGNGVSLVSLDYYHLAGDFRSIARRTTELAVASDGLDHPAFGAEMGAGAPPFFPPMDERDAQFTVMCAMAYGLRGYNIYMAVERDRWLGAPVDIDGVMRPFAAFWKRLGAAFDRVDFGNLRRHVPARIVVPRSVRRLARVMHAFGPISQALFRVMGAGMQESVLEDGIDFGDGHRESPPMRAGRALVAAERALDGEGVAYAFVDGGDVEAAFAAATDPLAWVIVPTSCGLDAPLIASLKSLHARGVPITLTGGPPLRDGSFRPLSPRTIDALPDFDLLLDDDALDVATVRAHIDDVIPDVARSPVRPDTCRATVHVDAAGKPRVVFLINPTRARQRIEVTFAGVHTVRDLFDGSTHALAEGVVVEPATLRMCEVVS